MDSSFFIVMGVVLGTVFLRLPDETSTFFSRGGALFW
jgi:ATP-binding cassette, subfamily G (WHITE), member 2, SNQ2